MTLSSQPGNHQWPCRRAPSPRGRAGSARDLAAGDQQLDSKNLDLDATSDRKVLTLLAARTLDTATEIKVVCQTISGPGYHLSNGQVVAVQVAAIR